MSLSNMYLMKLLYITYFAIVGEIFVHFNLNHVK